MRVFRDVDLVEHLGSGIPRILQHYGKECFKFSINFLRMTFPSAAPVTVQVESLKSPDNKNDRNDTVQVTMQVNLLVKALDGEMNGQEIQTKLGLSNRDYFRRGYLQPALEQGLIEMTVPDKPNSRLQKYRLSVAGAQLKEALK